MSSPLVSLQDICVVLDGRTVLDRISLQIETRDFLAIIGPNGGGKTTLLRVMLGLLAPQQGIVTFPSLQQRRPRIGYLPQATLIDRQFPITVQDVVGSGLVRRCCPGRRPARRERQRVHQLLEQTGVAQLEQRPIGRLSGGQLQRVMLARALAADPELLVLDEPNTYMDRPFALEFTAMLEQLQQDMAIVLVTHEIGVVNPLVRNIACINKTLDYHHGNKVHSTALQQYNCPVELLAHGPVPHRVIQAHPDGSIEQGER